jgi:hypothetical protein
LDGKFESMILKLLRERRRDAESGSIGGGREIVICEEVEEVVLAEEKHMRENASGGVKERGKEKMIMAKRSTLRKRTGLEIGGSRQGRESVADRLL